MACTEAQHRKYQRKLTDDEVRYARRVYAEGASINAIARQVGASPGSVFLIVNNRTYRDIQ